MKTSVLIPGHQSSKGLPAGSLSQGGWLGTVRGKLALSEHYRVPGIVPKAASDYTCNKCLPHRPGLPAKPWCLYSASAMNPKKEVPWPEGTELTRDTPSLNPKLLPVSPAGPADPLCQQESPYHPDSLAGGHTGEWAQIVTPFASAVCCPVRCEALREVTVPNTLRTSALFPVLPALTLRGSSFQWGSQQGFLGESKS